jgi:hypothetical protein
MAWRSVQLTQNGNSTRTWWFEGGDLTTHDCIVVGPTVGNSYLELTRKIGRRNPTRYGLTVRVIGAGAVAYRFWAEQMN